MSLGLPFFIYVGSTTFAKVAGRLVGIRRRCLLIDRGRIYFSAARVTSIFLLFVYFMFVLVGDSVKILYKKSTIVLRNS